MNAAPLHVAVASFCEAIVATGFTTTLTVKAAPVQLLPPVFVVGVTLYIAVAAAAVVLVRVPVTVAWPAPAAAPPVKFAPVGAFHA